MTRTQIAEKYLTMVGRDPRTAGVYVRLAYSYRVPFGRIVNISGLPAPVVLAHLEGGS